MILKKGDNNENVKKMQERLGISPAVTNFGTKTEEAVKVFQLKNGLKVDGIVGPDTWNKIMGTTTPTSSPVAVVKSTGPIKIENLKGHIPDAVLLQIPDTVAKFDLGTSLRLAHFLAQCGHESGGFKRVVERLNYSAQGLANTWPRRFAVDITQTPRIPNQLANTIQRNEEKIANVVYASRMGNGILTSGDGWKFRGRGYIQLTGKSNYIAFNRFVDDDVVVNPDLVATKYPLLSAAWFFNTNRIHILADSGASRANVEAVTRRVNGGLIGIDHRLSEFERYYKLLS
jgi:putative chitinase